MSLLGSKLSGFQAIVFVLAACVHAVTSVMSDSATPWTIAHQAPLSMGFSRQEYWSGFPCSPPGDLPNSGLEPEAPALQADSLLLSLWRSPLPSTVSLLHF